MLVEMQKVFFTVVGHVLHISPEKKQPKDASEANRIDIDYMTDSVAVGAFLRVLVAESKSANCLDNYVGAYILKLKSSSSFPSSNILPSSAISST